jgi:hypothetical protein
VRPGGRHPPANSRAISYSSRTSPNGAGPGGRATLGGSLAVASLATGRFPYEDERDTVRKEPGSLDGLQQPSNRSPTSDTTPTTLTVLPRSTPLYGPFSPYPASSPSRSTDRMGHEWGLICGVLHVIDCVCSGRFTRAGWCAAW